MWFGSQSHSSLFKETMPRVTESFSSWRRDSRLELAGFKPQLPLSGASPPVSPKTQKRSFLLCKMGLIVISAAQLKGLEIRNVSVAGVYYVFNNWPLLLLPQGHTLK